MKSWKKEYSAVAIYSSNLTIFYWDLSVSTRKRPSGVLPSTACPSATTTCTWLHTRSMIAWRSQRNFWRRIAINLLQCLQTCKIQRHVACGGPWHKYDLFHKTVDIQFRCRFLKADLEPWTRWFILSLCESEPKPFTAKPFIFTAKPKLKLSQVQTAFLIWRP